MSEVKQIVVDQSTVPTRSQLRAQKEKGRKNHLPPVNWKSSSVKMASVGVLALVLGAGVGLGSYALGVSHEREAFMSNAEGLSGNPFFNDGEYGGWEQFSPVESDQGASSSKQNPFRWTSGSCTFSASVAYLPTDLSGLGDEYLSNYALAQYKASTEGAITDKSMTSFNVNGKTVSGVSAKIGDNSYITTRAFDHQSSIAKDYMKTPSVLIPTQVKGKGEPVVLMVYSCTDKDALNFDTMKQLASDTSVRFE